MKLFPNITLYGKYDHIEDYICGVAGLGLHIKVVGLSPIEFLNLASRLNAKIYLQCAFNLYTDMGITIVCLEEILI